MGEHKFLPHIMLGALVKAVFITILCKRSMKLQKDDAKADGVSMVVYMSPWGTYPYWRIETVRKIMPVLAPKSLDA